MTDGHLSLASLVGGGLWILVALAHSFLGERVILGPLFRNKEWQLKGMPRPAAERLARFAWHLTSVAWVGLAALAFGAQAQWVLLVVAAVSAGMVLSQMRAHLAWPMFTVAALAAAYDLGLLEDVFRPVTMAAAAGFAVLGVLHLYWVLTGQPLKSVVPTTKEGQPVFRPGRMAALLVAATLLGFAALLWVSLGTATGWVRPGLAVGAVALLARAVGDGRYIGFSKSIRGTRFAQLDDEVFTPSVVLLAIGTVGALVS